MRQLIIVALIVKALRVEALVFESLVVEALVVKALEVEALVVEIKCQPGKIQLLLQSLQISHSILHLNKNGINFFFNTFLEHFFRETLKDFSDGQ